jgi:hypothetical protein
MANLTGKLLGSHQQYQVFEQADIDNQQEYQIRYKAYDLDRQRLVAVYELNIKENREQTVGRFLNYMKDQLSIKDPNLLEVLAYGTWPIDKTQVADQTEYCYVVTEWIEGWSLKKTIEELQGASQQLSLLDIIEIVQQTGCGIETLDLNQLAWRLPVDKAKRKTIGLSRGTNNYSAPKIINLDSIILVRAQPGSSAPFRVVLTDLGWQNLLDPEIEELKSSTLSIDEQQENVGVLGDLFYGLLHNQLISQADKEEEAAQKKQLLPPRLVYPGLPTPLEQVILTARAHRATHRYNRPRDMVAALARAIALVEGEQKRVGRLQVAILKDKLPALTDDQSETETGRIIADKTQLTVIAGASGKVTITVTNPEHRVDHFRLTISESTNDESATEWWTVTPRTGGRADRDQPTIFDLTIQPPLNTLASDYQFTVSALSVNANNRSVGEVSIKLTIGRVTNYSIDKIWPQVIQAYEHGQITVRNLGNATETFEFLLRSEDNQILFEKFERLTAIVPPHQATMVEFRPYPRKTPWFGRRCPHKISAQVNVLHAGKLELLDGTVQVPSTIPPIGMITLAVGLLASLLFLLLYNKPSVALETGDWCKRLPDNINEPALLICWNKNFGAQSYDSNNQLISGHIKSLALLLAPKGPEVPITRTWGIITSTSPILYIDTYTRAELLAYIYHAPNVFSTVDRPRLIARNRLGEQTWLGPLAWLGTSYYDIPYQQLIAKVEVTPAPAPPPMQGKITRFCVTSDEQQVKPVCTITETAVLPIFFGQTSMLNFSWETINVTDAKPIFEPFIEQVDIANRRAVALAPTPRSEPYLYTLSMVDAAGATVDGKSLLVAVNELSCRVDASQVNSANGLAMRKSPGDNYELIGVLAPDTEVIALTAAVDYAQNEDNQRWVKVMVRDTKEEGWVASEGLVCGAPIPGSIASMNQPLGDASMASGASGSAGATNADSVQNLTAGVPDLPVEKPVFGPTLTPEATPTFTPTVAPTPAPTLEPLQIEIQVDKEEIAPKECIKIQWTIRGVQAVYFDHGTGELQPSNDNVDRTIERCDLKRTTTFAWKIIIDQSQSIIRDETRKVVVKSRPDE